MSQIDFEALCKKHPKLCYKENHKNISISLGYDNIFHAIHELYFIEGLSVKQTGKYVGMYCETVLNYIKKMGLNPRQRGGNNHRINHTGIFRQKGTGLRFWADGIDRKRHLFWRLKCRTCDKYISGDIPVTHSKVVSIVNAHKCGDIKNIDLEDLGNKIYFFECGCSKHYTLINTKQSTIKCPEHHKRIKYITNTCINCGILMKIDKMQNFKQRLCPDCYQDLNKHRSRNGKKNRIKLKDQKSRPGDTLEKVGSELGVTRERARQIEVKAIRVLKNHFIGHFGDEIKTIVDFNSDLKIPITRKWFKAMTSTKNYVASRILYLKEETRDPDRRKACDILHAEVLEMDDSELDGVVHEYVMMSLKESIKNIQEAVKESAKFKEAV